MNTIELLKLSDGMAQLRATMKQLHGDAWPERSMPYREVIKGAMEGSGDTNPLSAVLPMAKEMSARGKNPMMLLAVAVDMAQAPNISS